MTRAYFLGIFAVFIWSFNIIVAKYLVDVLSPIQITYFRWFFAMVFLLPFTLNGIWQYRKDLIKGWRIVLSSSVLGVVLLNNFVYIAGHTASAIDMSLIGSTGPILLVILASVFQKEYMSLRRKIGFMVTIVGVLMIIFKGKFQEISFVEGDFWMIAMSICFAIYGLLTSMRPKQVPQIILLSTTIVLAVLILTPLFLDSLTYHPIVKVTDFDWMILLYMGLFNSIVAFFCWNEALEKLGSVKTSVIYYLMPLFTVIEADLFFGEKVVTSQIYGGIVVLIGVLITIVAAKVKITVQIERA